MVLRHHKSIRLCIVVNERANKKCNPQSSLYLHCSKLALEMRTCARECFVYPDIKKTRWLFRRVAQFAYAHNCVSLVNSSYSLLNEDILAMLWFKHEGSSRNQWYGICAGFISTLVEIHFITHHCALWIWGSCEMWITSHSCCNGWEAIFSQRAVYCRHVYNLRAT